MITKYLQYIKESNKYKTNDYVLLDVEKIRERVIDEMSDITLEEDDDDYEYVDILQKYARIFMTMSRDYTPIRVMFSDSNIYDVEEDEIIRFLNPDEIEEYNSQINAKKYNL
jgi:hypothetical protein